MRPLAVVAAILVAAVTTVSAFAQDLSGNYRVRGWNADGSQYTGTVNVFFSPRLDVHSVTWRIAGTQYDGTGTFTRNGQFEVEYPGGVAYYTLRRDGSLDGTWGTNRRSLTGREVWTPLR